jgi:hypothetical protein
MAPILRIAAAAAAALVLLPAGTSGGTTGSGLYGTVRKGPVKPVCQAGVPCDAPVARTMLVFSKAGTEVARVRATAQGTYRIALAPGYYDVRATVKIGVTRLPKPHAVHVRAGHWDRINLFFDTGIR